MSISKPIAALAAGCLMLLGAAALAQTGGPAQRPAKPASRPWSSRSWRGSTGSRSRTWPPCARASSRRWSSRSACRSRRTATIGVLHHEIAELTVTKNKLQAESDRSRGEGRGPEGGRRSRSSPATSGSTSGSRAWSRPKTSPRPRASSRSPRPRSRKPRRTGRSPRPSSTWPKQTLEEHTIVAPFDGIVIKRMKNPGESVRANEAVVELGNLEQAGRRRLRPARLRLSRQGGPGRRDPAAASPAERGEPLPIEKKRFRGKITFVDPADPAGGRDGRPDPRRVRESRLASCGPGLMVQMTIFLTPKSRRPAPRGPHRPGRHAPSNLTNVGRRRSGPVPARSAATPAFDPHETRGLPTHERRSHPGPRHCRSGRPPNTWWSSSGPTWSSSPSSTRG